MDVEQALYNRLVDQVTTVSSRVSAAPAPEGWANPVVTYQLLSGAHEVGFGGVRNIWLPSFQVTAWAATYEGLMAVVAQIRTALDGWAASLSGLTVDFAYIENQKDLQDTEYDPPLVGRAFDVTVSCEGGG